MSAFWNTSSSFEEIQEEGITAKEVCDELGISTREFRRWRDELELLGGDAFLISRLPIIDNPLLFCGRECHLYQLDVRFGLPIQLIDATQAANPCSREFHFSAGGHLVINRRRTFRSLEIREFACSQRFQAFSALER